MGHSRYPFALSPLRLGRSIRLRNRIFFAPMGIDVAHPDGTASEEMAAFYRGIIDGGPGMVVLGNASVDAGTRLQERGLCLRDRRQAQALAPLLRYGQDRDCPVVVQLQHYGAQGSVRMGGGALLSPSGVPCPRIAKADPDYRTIAMTMDDIRAVQAQFARAAALAQQAGARLVSLQASNGYLLSSFLSPHTNRRQDDYGGDAARRMRFLLEVIAAIRTAAPGIEISVRLGIDDCLPEGGQRPDLLLPCLAMLEQAGVASLECSMSIGQTFASMLSYSPEASQRLQNGVATIRKGTGLKLGFAGFVGSLEAAEEAMLATGADLIGMTRALFADNDLVAKAAAGDPGIHRCRFDGNCFRDKGNPRLDRVYCCVNPKYLRPAEIVYS